MEKDIKKYSNKKLANYFRIYNYMVSEQICYGTRDVKILMILEKEILDRCGYINDNNGVVINKRKY
jgi:hypothetical protein